MRDALLRVCVDRDRPCADRYRVAPTLRLCPTARAGWRRQACVRLKSARAKRVMRSGITQAAEKCSRSWNGAPSAIARRRHGEVLRAAIHQRNEPTATSPCRSRTRRLLLAVDDVVRCGAVHALTDGSGRVVAQQSGRPRISAPHRPFLPGASATRPIERCQRCVDESQCGFR